MAPKDVNTQMHFVELSLSVQIADAIGDWLQEVSKPCFQIADTTGELLQEVSTKLRFLDFFKLKKVFKSGIQMLIMWTASLQPSWSVGEHLMVKDSKSDVDLRIFLFGESLKCVRF